ncbi:MAG TPA: type II secretion system secretin GspD [Kofleriaceae bacterium]|nr:type II secretion system secretin GspD [Kofleriaceae bacterium]
MINTSRHSIALALVLAAAVLVSGARPSIAQPAPPAPGTADPPPGEDAMLYACGKAKASFAVTLKQETELKDLLTWAMSFTCKNFIYESSILQRSKKLTIIAPNKMTPQQAYRVFLVSLSTMGLTVVPKGNILRVVEAANAKSETVPIYKKGSPGNSDDVVRLILRPQHTSVDELSNALSVVKSNIGVIQPVPKAGVLVITDYSSHIRDMVTVTKELDRPASGEGIYTIQVKFSDAVQLAAKLTEILGTSTGGGGGGGGPQGGKGGGGADGVAGAVPTKIMADERTNTLILLSSEAGYLRVKALVDRLDVGIEGGDTGSVHVYQLENANAEELATTLNAALTGVSQGQRNTPGGGRTPAGRQAAPAPQFDGGGVGGAGGAAFEGQVRITHDAPTNSLVVLSSGRDFQALKEVVRALDIPRRQVFIEAVILELNVGNGLDLGTSFHGGLPVGEGDDSLVFGGVQSSDLKSLQLSTLISATGLIGGLLGPILPQSQELLGTSIPSYAVLFQALAKSSNVNVLSSPHILATNNQEAEISVGQNIPYIGGVNFGLPTGGATGGIPGFGNVSIQRQDIQLSMKITPAINASNMVTLKIEQEIQDIGERDPQLGPSWTKRKIKTTVVVKDQQSIVIGGLISDRVSYSESKVPFLGDIPILGYLFKYTKRDKKKTNLLVLLTPYVIQDQLDLNAIVERKVRERNEFLRAFYNLDKQAYLPRVDYRRKRGLIEEINRTIQATDVERDLLQSLQQRDQGVVEGAVEYNLKGGADDMEDPDAPKPETKPETPPAPQTQPAPKTEPKTAPKTEPKTEPKK